MKMYSIEVDGKHVVYNQNGEITKAWEYSDFLDQDVEITDEINNRRKVLSILPYQNLDFSEKLFLNNLADWFETAINRQKEAREYANHFDYLDAFKEERERKLGG